LLWVFDAAARTARFESSPAATAAAEEILRIASSMLAMAPIAESPEGRPKYPRREIIQRAMEFLEQQEKATPSVGQMAAAAAVSERTLRTAFNEYFGVGPIRFLRLRQLHQVRRVLKTADAEQTSVSQILVAHGEWAFSRFAKQYRLLFGELPSETLCNSPGKKSW
jgi:AraC family ethanolamine operon transcriptional activator